MQLFALAAVFTLILASPAWAQSGYDDPKTAEGWAWAKIRNDEVVDFNTREGCSGRLDPHRLTGSDDACRQVSPQFLVDLLTKPKFRDQIPRHGVRLRGTRIIGEVDLADTDILPQVAIEASRIEGALTLDDSRLRRPLSLAGSTVGGDVSAARIHADSTIMLSNALFQGAVDLSGVRIGDDLDISGSTFDGDVSLENGRIGGNLLMGGSAFGGDVLLLNATINGTASMEAAQFADKLHAEGLNVGHDLFMHLGAEFRGEVFLIRARIGGGLELRGAKAWFVDLSEAEAAELQIGGLEWWCAGGMTLNAGPLGTVAGDESFSWRWPLGDTWWRQARCKQKDGTDLPEFSLRNVHVGALQDSSTAWPPSLDLEGFRYDRLGGIAGVSRAANAGPDDMRRRSAAEWTDWLERDRTFSSQPYVELGSVLAAAGHRDTADKILFAGRERERQLDWAEGSYLQWGWLTFLAYVAGYGIGLYTFFVLLWVLGLTELGAIVLRYSKTARRRGWLWRLGASLHRLLPIIELSKEFSDFFDNPAPQPGDDPNLNHFQAAYFAGHAIAGWVLGFFLIAAMGGIIQKA